jgi:hypothetical protein
MTAGGLVRGGQSAHSPVSRTFLGDSRRMVGRTYQDKSGISNKNLLANCTTLNRIWNLKMEN